VDSAHHHGEWGREVTIFIYMDNGHHITAPGADQGALDTIREAMAKNTSGLNVIRLSGGIDIVVSKITYIRVEQ